MADERTLAQILAQISHDQTVVMQSAWIEWKHGGGAEAAMVWIENHLDGPGLIPDEAEPDELAWTHGHPSWAQNAQLWFAANKSNPFPTCPCGRPSSYAGDGRGWCSPEHRELEAIR